MHGLVEFVIVDSEVDFICEIWMNFVYENKLNCENVNFVYIRIGISKGYF